MTALLPTIKWAQRKDRVFLTIDLRDIEHEIIEWISPSQLKIEVTSDKKIYATVLELFEEVNIEESKWNKTGLHLQFNLVKKETGPYWKRLTKEDKKFNHIALDWSKYVDEDEEDEEAKKGLGNEWDPDMMKGFGGMGGMGGMPGMGGMGGMGGMPGMGGFGGMPGMMGGMPGMGGMGDDDSDDDEEGHEHEHGDDHDHHGHDHHGHDHHGHAHGKGKLDDLDRDEEIATGEKPKGTFEEEKDEPKH
jgi:hypothetical protein